MQPLFHVRALGLIGVPLLGLLVQSLEGDSPGPAPAPSWGTAPPAQWNADQVKAVLEDSPWAMAVKATVTRRLTEEQMMLGGRAGQGRGVGWDGVDPRGSGSDPKGTSRSQRSFSRAIALRLRWESALPVRVAVAKSQEFDATLFDPPLFDPPKLDGDGEGYRVAVFGVPGAGVHGDPKKLGDPLKKDACLKREGKKDVKPLRVEVFPGPDGLVVVYLFPLSAEISPKDPFVEFEAQIGRIVVSHKFDLAGMNFMGKLEL